MHYWAFMIGMVVGGILSYLGALVAIREYKRQLEKK
jgi:hypothetical protein